MKLHELKKERAEIGRKQISELKEVNARIAKKEAEAREDKNKNWDSIKKREKTKGKILSPELAAKNYENNLRVMKTYLDAVEKINKEEGQKRYHITSKYYDSISSLDALIKSKKQEKPAEIKKKFDAAGNVVVAKKKLEPKLTYKTIKQQKVK